MTYERGVEDWASPPDLEAAFQLDQLRAPFPQGGLLVGVQG